MIAIEQKARGFTLIELMIVVMIVAVLAAIAMPSYQAYGRKAAASAAQQEMLKLAEQLERHKGKNFNYACFDLAGVYGGAVGQTTKDLPIGATGTAVQYTLTLVDNSSTNVAPLYNTACGATPSGTKPVGRKWAIKATKSANGLQTQNYNLLLNSDGVRCMTKNTISVYTSCGASDYETW